MGKTFKVEYFDFDAKMTRNGMNGNISFDKQKIQIDNTLNVESQEECLLHEIVHAVSDLLAMDLEEKTVHALTCGLYQVFKDNDLFKEEK